MPLARSFSNVARTINQATRQLNSVATGIQPLTSAASQGVAQVRGLASQAGNVNINSRELTNGFSAVQQAGQRVTNVAGQIGNLSGLGNVNVNQLLSTATFNLPGPLGQIGSIGNVVSNFTNTISGIAGAVQSLTSGSSLGNLGSLLGNFNISQFATNIINVIPRDFGELAFDIGGEFDSLRQRIESLGDVSNLSDFVNLTFPGIATPLIGESAIYDDAILRQARTSRGNSKSKIPNPLRNHNGFNYIISLACMSDIEINFPETYRNRGGFDQYILRSGGGFYNNRYQVFDEAAGNTIGADGNTISDHAEYYIEDLEIDAVIAPNPNTSVSMGTTIRFTVIEPYSMGNFIEAIIGSVREKSPTSSPVGWPFCLQIDFVGWNEDGQTDANFVTAPMFIPINIINTEFNVTGQGSTYDVQAVAYSEIALSDTINQIVTDVEAVGTKIYQVLNGEDESVTAAINQRIDNLEDNDVIAVGDRYIIAFPQDLNAFRDAARGISPGIDLPDSGAEFIRNIQGTAELFSGEIQRLEQSLAITRVQPTSQMFEVLSSVARDESKMNEIGLSLIVEDTSDGGNHSFGNPAQAHSPESDGTVRSDPTMQVSEKGRTYAFSQGDRITNIIEDILLKSRYAAERATEESAANGTRQWFKIETQVFIDETAQSSTDRGRPARIYVYNVIPYFVNESRHLGVNEAPKNVQGLKDLAVKEYNYIYTGLNEDIIDFDLTFNNSFLQTALANLGQNPGGEGHGGDQKILNSGSDTNTGVGTNRNSSDNASAGVGAEIAEVVAYNGNNGTRSRDVKLQIAEMFHNTLINQPTDLLTAEMRIFGDPFFVPQQTGNYIGEIAGGNPNLTQDGNMRYFENEVYVMVNFKTPFDYQIEGATMEFPRVVPQFSGLFTAWAVTNNFSKGRFEQNLKLIRVTKQDQEPTTGNRGSVVVDDSRSIVEAVFRPDGTIAGPGQAARPGAGAPPVVRAGGITFDPRTDVFQPPSRVIDTPSGRQTVQPPPVTIYDDAIFRTTRNQTPPAAPRPPVNSGSRPIDPNRVGPQ